VAQISCLCASTGPGGLLCLGVVYANYESAIDLFEGGPGLFPGPSGRVPEPYDAVILTTKTDPGLIQKLALTRLGPAGFRPASEDYWYGAIP
jgi:hypothetical protein